MKSVYKQKYLEQWHIEWYQKKHSKALWLALGVAVLIILWSGLK